MDTIDKNEPIDTMEMIDLTLCFSGTEGPQWQNREANPEKM
jgi:hypothetical protein